MCFLPKSTGCYVVNDDDDDDDDDYKIIFTLNEIKTN